MKTSWDVVVGYKNRPDDVLPFYHNEKAATSFYEGLRLEHNATTKRLVRTVTDVQIMREASAGGEVVS